MRQKKNTSGLISTPNSTELREERKMREEGGRVEESGRRKRKRKAPRGEGNCWNLIAQGRRRRGKPGGKKRVMG